MVVVAGAFGFPRKQVGPESFSSRHNIQQPPFLQQSGFIFQCNSQAMEFQHSGAIDRNWPALLQGIHNTNASSQSQYSGGGTMPDSRDAFLSLWNPLCHLFLLFSLRFCALLFLHSYVHLFWCFQVKDDLRLDQARWQQIILAIASYLPVHLQMHCIWVIYTLFMFSLEEEKQPQNTSWWRYLMLCKLSYQSKELPLILCSGTCSIGGAIVQCLQRSCFVTALKRRRRQSCHMCCSALNDSLPLLLFLQPHPSLLLLLLVSFSLPSVFLYVLVSSARPAASYKPRSLV